MRVGDVSQMPNPFAPDPPSGDDRRVQKSSVIAAAKLLLIVALGFAMYVVVTSRGPEWLATRLSSDFESLDTQTKVSRLNQLSELGTLGIPGVVQALADPETIVADRSYELLRNLQTSWASMPKDASTNSQQVLATSLENIRGHLPHQRQLWIDGLLRQVAEVAVIDQSTGLPARADSIGIEAVQNSNANPHVLHEQPTRQPDDTYESTIGIASELMAADHTDWSGANAPIVQVGYDQGSSVQDADSIELLPTSRRTSMEVRSVRDVVSETSFRVAPDHIAYLAADQRVAAIDELTVQQSLEFRAQLLLLLDDPDREIRLHAASKLAEAMDDQVREYLLKRLSIEADQHVAARIRTVLRLR